MKYFTALIVLICFLVPSTGRAESVLQSVWYEPFNTAPGDAITLSALLYNKDQKPVTFTVVFDQNGAMIGTPVVVVVGGVSAKTVSIKTTQPQQAQTVTASVTAAINSLKKDVPALHGVIGTVTIGPPATDTTVPLSLNTSSIIAFGLSIKEKVDVFRIAQAKHFATVRDDARQKLGLPSAPSVTDVLMPKAPSAPGAFTSEEATSGIKIYKADNPLEYPRLVGATALAAFFGQAMLFYIVLVIVFFFVLRFLYRMFI